MNGRNDDLENCLLMREEANRSCIYARKGYRNRWHYLIGLSKEYNVSFREVVSLANMLGPMEDFDGLLTELELIQMQMESAT